jgi:hypothetical protein
MLPFAVWETMHVRNIPVGMNPQGRNAAVVPKDESGIITFTH